MALKRTGETQIEATATGIITTAKEVGRIEGKKVTRWAQIGYTSVVIDSEGKKYVDGPYGARLL